MKKIIPRYLRAQKLVDQMVRNSLSSYQYRSGLKFESMQVVYVRLQSQMQEKICNFRGDRVSLLMYDCVQTSLKLGKSTSRLIAEGTYVQSPHAVFHSLPYLGRDADYLAERGRQCWRKASQVDQPFTWRFAEKITKAPTGAFFAD